MHATFVEGARVECHPGTDTWMMGDRYGTVRKTTWKRIKSAEDDVRREIVHVHMDRSNKVKRFAAVDLEQI